MIGLQRLRRRFAGYPLSGWVLGAVTLVQAFLLTVACGIAVAAAKRVEPIGETVPFYRRPLALAHCILGLTSRQCAEVRQVVRGDIRLFKIECGVLQNCNAGAAGFNQ